MRKAVREELDRIEDFLMRDNEESKDLMSILSAMRGPDDGDNRTKKAATIPIRRQAFPRLTGVTCWMSIWDFNGSDEVDHDRDMRFENPHFTQHIEMAENAIRATDSELFKHGAASNPANPDGDDK